MKFKHLSIVYRYFVFCILSLVLTACATNESKIDNRYYAATPPVQHAAPPIRNGSIYQGQASSYIFEDMKAKRVGDILTVILSEKTNATKTASTTTKKENTTDFAAPTVFGAPITHNGRNLLSGNAETSQEFTGEGDSEQSNALNGTISVTIAEVYPNGNMFVKGQKRMLLNQGEEYIQITGIIRPMDVSLNNTVSSTLIADARITYSGRGAVSDANKMGWLARFFNSQLWPF